MKAIAALDGWSNSAVASATYTLAAWTMEFGTIDGISSGTVTLIGNDRGMTSSERRLRKHLERRDRVPKSRREQQQHFRFLYLPRGGRGGGVAVGVRWSHSSQDGDFAFINTNATPPVMELHELTSGWTAGQSVASSSLNLTVGNTYTLVIVDNGTDGIGMDRG